MKRIRKKMQRVLIIYDKDSFSYLRSFFISQFDSRKKRTDVKEKEKKTNWRGLETTLRREEEDGEKKTQ